MSCYNTSWQTLRSAGTNLLACVSRRQASRAQLGKLLDAGWARQAADAAPDDNSAPVSKTAGAPAHSGQ